MLLSRRRGQINWDRWKLSGGIDRRLSGTATWSQTEVGTLLQGLLLDPPTSLSCLAVETLPGTAPNLDPVGIGVGYERFLRTSPLRPCRRSADLNRKCGCPKIASHDLSGKRYDRICVGFRMPAFALALIQAPTLWPASESLQGRKRGPELRPPTSSHRRAMTPHSRNDDCVPFRTVQL